MDYKPHPYSKFFPLMEGDEFKALVEDIREHGLMEPIVILEGQVLDGRNRLRACQKAGIKPKFEKYEGNGALDFVISKNVQRRHLTISQLSAISIDMLPEFEKEAAERERINALANLRRGKALPGNRNVAGPGEPGTAASHVAKRLGIGERTVVKAKDVAKNAPDLLPKVRSGEVSVHDAYREASMRRARESAKKDHEAREAHKRQERPREVKDYLEATAEFCRALETAKRVAAYGKFAPEAQRFVQGRHQKIRDLMLAVEREFS